MADELHYPPGAEPNPPTPEPTPEPTPVPPKEPEQAPEPTPEAPKPGEKDKKPDEPAPEVPLLKKRSIYDDLKDERQDKAILKSVVISALEAQGVKLVGNETAEELQALAKKTPSQASPTPEPSAPSKPTNELEAYAQENGLDATQLARLAEIIAKSIPQGQLSAEEKQQLTELTEFKAKKEAEELRTAEDNAVRAEAPKVKETLQIHDEAELKAVMDEVVRLSHTERFHDKEVGYIVWANLDALSKLVSPKKPSFESGQSAALDAEPKEVEFSGKMTPETAQKEMHKSAPKTALTIRRGA